MNDQLPMLNPPISEAMSSVISSPGSAAGAKPSDLPESPALDLFGQPLSPASHSAQPANNSASKMSVISGPSSSTSLKSAALTLSLGNKLRERLDSIGSMEYDQTWKLRTTQSGLQYWEHTASARRTKECDSTGWRTPQATDGMRGVEENPKLRSAKAGTGSLNNEAALTHWPTPKAQDAKTTWSPGKKRCSQELTRTVQVVTPWASPSARDWKDSPGMSTTGINPDGSERSRLDQLPRQAMLAPWPSPTNSMVTEQDLAQAATAGNGKSRKQYADSGIMPSGSIALTEKRGALNPAFSLWLMGYRDAWASCGEQAMLLCRKLPRNSLKPSSKSKGSK